jgi:hypothetical protein
LCSTRPDRSGALDDHSLIPGWEEAGFDTCVGEVYYANQRRPGRTTFQRPEVSPWMRLGRTQWACKLCSATVCYTCSPVIVYPTTGHTPAEYLAASCDDDTHRRLRQLARDFGAAAMVVGGRLGAVDHCGRSILHAPVGRLDLVELVCLLAKNPCGGVSEDASKSNQNFGGGVPVVPSPLRTAGLPDPATPAASLTRDRVGGGGAHPPLGLTGLGRHKGPVTDDDLDGGLASDDY